MPTATAAPLTLKADLRALLRQRRASCDPALGTRLAWHVLSVVRLPPGSVIAGYWPLDGEIDVRPLLLAWHEQGYMIALPQTPPRGHPLDFHRWQPGASLLSGRFGTSHPKPDPVTPDLLLVPLLGFDRALHRLGYGAGYYDRTIAALPGIRTIGCAFAAQEVDAIPTEPHDRRLDMIATENGIIKAAAAP